MVTFGAAVGAIVKSTSCAVLAFDDNALRLMRRVGFPNDSLSNSIGAIRRELCSNPRPPVIPPNYLGGQCPVRYKVTITYDQVNPQGVVQAPQTLSRDFLLGPLGAIYKRGAFATKQVGVDTAQGFQVIAENTSEDVDYANLRNPIIFRQDGQPDNCGNNDDNTDNPPQPTTINVDINYDNDNNTNITENGDLTIFAPIANFNGELSFPINLDLGGVDINGELNLNGDFTFSPSFPVSTGDEPDKPPPTIPTPPPTIPPAPPRRMIGAKVYVISNNGFSVGVIDQDENPDILIPRAGSIQFYQPAGDRPGWSPDIDVKTSVAWIPCPSPGYATAVAGTPRLGVEWQINPVYDRPEK